MKQKTSRDFSIILVFPILFGINLLLYYKSFNAGFVTDFTGLQEKLETQPFSNFIYSYGYPIVQPLLQLFNALFYKVFHIDPWAWFLYFVSLHSLVAALLLRFSTKIFQSTGSSNGFYAGFAASLIFIVSAYHPEILCWRISTAFLWSGIWILISLINAVEYLCNRRMKNLIIMGFSNAAGLLTFEWGLIILPAVLVLGLYIMKSEASRIVNNAFWKTALVSSAITLIYFLLNYLSFGSILAHYGSEVHFSVDIWKISGNIWKYFLKHILLVHYYPYYYRDLLYSFFDKHYIILLFTVSTLGVCTVFLSRLISGKHKLFVLLISILCFISLIPVSNLSFEYLFRSENDRYGYIFSIFLSILLGYIFVRSYKWVKGLFVIWICFSIFFQQQMMNKWNQNKRVFWGLMESFDAADADTIIALNMPDNLGGTFLFRDFSGGSSFADGVQYTARKAVSPYFMEVCQYNMVHATDGVRVEALSDSSLYVQFNQFGNWFWKRGRNASYETDFYRVEQGEASYTLTFKAAHAHARIIYQDGPEWKVFKF